MFDALGFPHGVPWESEMRRAAGTGFGTSDPSQPERKCLQNKYLELIFRRGKNLQKPVLTASAKWVCLGQCGTQWGFLGESCYSLDRLVA